MQMLLAAAVLTPIRLCDTYVRSQDGMTFLMLAITHRSESLAELVLQHKADVNQENEMKPVREGTCRTGPTHSVT